MDYERIIKEVYDQVNNIKDGALANYIPELAKVDPEKFAVSLHTIEGKSYGLGDTEHSFSIQSIAKVLSLCMAYRIQGEELWNRLGVEPSGTRFNSLVQLEHDQGIPRNPFMNSGALVISDILISHLDNPKEDFLKFVRNLSNNPSLNYSSTVSDSEKSVGYLNKALANFLKSFGNLHNEPEEVLEFYFDLCSLELNCRELSSLFLFMANNGSVVADNQKVISKSQCKRINALMQTCGFYDESGEFAFKVGLPGKSGVSGGIIAIHPNQYSIAVWSPRLNQKGNSYKGVRFLEAFTSLSELSIF